MSTLNASLWLTAEDLIQVRAHRATPWHNDNAPVLGAVDIAQLTIRSDDPEALDDLAAALTEAATRMRIVARTEPVAS